ncbi:hypothetical protein C4K12_1552 [Pseudomonas chlororaphis subsp. aureofaciens]|nr:hypothetical protein C4K12_1552 [Pseudomonas chlororaphis subsp. aureofaciens]
MAMSHYCYRPVLLNLKGASQTKKAQPSIKSKAAPGTF